MDYYEFVFDIVSEEDYHRDLLIDSLSEAGFDTFEETETGFKAYIALGQFDEDLFEKSIQGYKDIVVFSYSRSLIPQKNWNEVWESNFEPISVKDLCYVRATFHEPKPEFPYEIVIDPKMAFGTGHHQTTSMMMEYALEEDLKGKVVLDMGCGTGILAILAAKTGAAEVTAIDYDAVCYESTLENAALNGVSRLEVHCGSKEVIPDKDYDVIFANINRNILLDQIERYTQVLKEDGILLLSGFYESDIQVLAEEGFKYSLTHVAVKQRNDWVAIKMVKQ